MGMVIDSSGVVNLKHILGWKDHLTVWGADPFFSTLVLENVLVEATEISVNIVVVQPPVLGLGLGSSHFGIITC